MDDRPSPVPLRTKANNMSVGECEAAREGAFTFASVDDIFTANIERILNVPRQFVKSALAYYESGQRGQKYHRGITPESLEAVRLKIYIKETGKITDAKGSLPLFAKHCLEATVDDAFS